MKSLYCIMVRFKLGFGVGITDTAHYTYCTIIELLSKQILENL